MASRVGGYAGHDARPSPIAIYGPSVHYPLRTYALLRALETLQLCPEPDVEGVCPWWASPLRTLVRVSGLQIFTIIDVFARLEPPHGRAPPELNPTNSRSLGTLKSQQLISVGGEAPGVWAPRYGGYLRDCRAGAQGR
jgi:hypothetical protein